MSHLKENHTPTGVILPKNPPTNRRVKKKCRSMVRKSDQQREIGIARGFAAEDIPGRV
ncbi:MAG: hypothetical protein FWG65_13120 [Turicibacter sp.]|nr:hypothetical protein [Turicibacter sp.]